MKRRNEPSSWWEVNYITKSNFCENITVKNKAEGIKLCKELAQDENMECLTVRKLDGNEILDETEVMVWHCEAGWLI